MITALISTITGAISGMVPDVLQEWRDSRDHKRETEMLQLQTDLQLKIADKNAKVKVAEMEMGLEVTAYDTAGKIAMQSMKDSGSAFANAWNGILRPFTVTIIIGLYAYIAWSYTNAVLDAVVTLDDSKQAVTLLWGSLVGESIQAVLGFLFGYRSTRK